MLLHVWAVGVSRNESEYKESEICIVVKTLGLDPPFVQEKLMCSKPIRQSTHHGVNMRAAVCGLTELGIFTEKIFLWKSLNIIVISIGADRILLGKCL